MNLAFSVNAWAACAPGLSTPAQWQDWAAQPFLCLGDDQPALPQMPSLLRRRLGQLGRLAAQVAYSVHDGRLGVPVVLGSRYGDTARSLELLTQLIKDEAISPTAFGLSVHNAIGAMYSIANKDRANYTAVAAGAHTMPASLIEAVGLLHDGAKEVLLICYDAPLPGPYAVFERTPVSVFAVAWRLALPQSGQARFELHRAQRAWASGACDLPFGLDALRFFLAGKSCLERQVDDVLWRLSRHDH